MSGLCGWFRPAGAVTSAPDPIASMAATLGRFDGAAVRSVAAEYGAAAVAGRDADVFQEGPLTAAVWGNAGFKQGAIAELASRHGAARAIAEAYARHESSLLKDVSGSFAIAVHDARSGGAEPVHD